MVGNLVSNRGLAEDKLSLLSSSQVALSPSPPSALWGNDFTFDFFFLLFVFNIILFLLPPTWQSTYFPVLPVNLVEYVDKPGSFLFGVVGDIDHELPGGVSCPSLEERLVDCVSLPALPLAGGQLADKVNRPMRVEAVSASLAGILKTVRLPVEAVSTGESCCWVQGAFCNSHSRSPTRHSGPWATGHPSFRELVAHDALHGWHSRVDHAYKCSQDLSACATCRSCWWTWMVTELASLRPPMGMKRRRASRHYQSQRQHRYTLHERHSDLAIVLPLSQSLWTSTSWCVPFTSEESFLCILFFRHSMLPVRSAPSCSS